MLPPLRWYSCLLVATDFNMCVMWYFVYISDQSEWIYYLQSDWLIKPPASWLNLGKSSLNTHLAEIKLHAPPLRMKNWAYAFDWLIVGPKWPMREVITILTLSKLSRWHFQDTEKWNLRFSKRLMVLNNNKFHYSVKLHTSTNNLETWNSKKP